MKKTKQSVLVTGGAGFIGSALARLLLANGYSVDIVDNLSTGKRENVPEGATFVHLDLCQSDASDHLPRTDYAAIAHFAAQSSGEVSFDDPLHDFDTNARATMRLALWACQHKIPAFLLASSMTVYGHTDQYPVTEGAPQKPTSFYAVAKAAGENFLRILAKREDLRVCILRMFNVYGPGQNLANTRQGMLSIYLSFLLNQKPILVKGSLDRIRDFVYIDDVTNAWKRALEKPVIGIYNLGSGKPTSVREAISTMVAAAGLPSDYPVTVAEGTPGDQKAMLADIAAIKRDLDWKPQIDLDEGLKRMVAWARGTI
jgi:UDP-glucose 4-epimerase